MSPDFGRQLPLAMVKKVFKICNAVHGYYSLPWEKNSYVLNAAYRLQWQFLPGNAFKDYYGEKSTDYSLFCRSPSMAASQLLEFWLDHFGACTVFSASEFSEWLNAHCRCHSPCYTSHAWVSKWSSQNFKVDDYSLCACTFYKLLISSVVSRTAVSVFFAFRVLCC